MLSNTAFIGLSHLGLVTSICWTKICPKVIAIDSDVNLIKKLKKGNLEIREGHQILYEPKLEKMFHRYKKNYTVSSDFKPIKKSELVFITKDTPTDGVGSQEELKKLMLMAIPNFRKDVTIILMSQVKIGTCQNLIKLIRSKRPNLKFKFYHWVDTIIMTNAVERFLKPERIIIGRDNRYPPNQTLKKCLSLFKCPVFYMSYNSAELTKAFINLYLATSITYANTLAHFCESYDSDINDIIPALKSDKRIGASAYIKPTLSIAGGHLERDIIMLNNISNKLHLGQKLISVIIQENLKRYKWAIQKINKNINFGKTKPIICLWGLTYKKGSSSIHNAASMKIINELSKKAIIRTYDPMAILPPNVKKIERFKNKYEALKRADCLLILTDWDEFKNIDLKKIAKLMKKTILIDCVGTTNPNNKTLSKFKYYSLGVGLPLQ